jgi:membrane protease subunit HflC
MGAIKTLGIVVLAVLAIVVWSAAFTVNERERAIVLQFGEVKRAINEPGLYFKVPVVNSVRKFDKRILTFDAEPENYLTDEKKNLLVDSFVKWRIDDPIKYYTTMSGDERRASLRLGQIIKDGLRGEFGKRTIQQVVAEDRADMMAILTEQANTIADQFGIKVVDVRIKRIDLPTDVSEAVYNRMRAERKRVAQELRAQGAEAAERIRADADRQREVLLAQAYRDAEQVRGEGDAKATETYAAAYGQDPEFFSLYRSLDAYQTAFEGGNNLMVLEPDSEFFQYFRDVAGEQRQ